MSGSEAEVEKLAIDIWLAVGHNVDDWAFMAPELHRKRRYMAYARNLLKIQSTDAELIPEYKDDGTVGLVEKENVNQGQLMSRVAGEWVYVGEK